MKNYLYVGALAVPLAIANQSGYQMNCEVRELACRRDPEHPHSPEEMPVTVVALTTHTATGTTIGNLSALGTATSSAFGNLTALTPITTGTMVNGNPWS